jgi:hypothetical protein
MRLQAFIRPHVTACTSCCITFSSQEGFRVRLFPGTVPSCFTITQRLLHLSMWPSRFCSVPLHSCYPSFSSLDLQARKVQDLTK